MHSAENRALKRRAFGRLLKDTTANVLPLAAAGMLVLVGLVGGGVDASRAYMVKNRLQNACDSAVLAGRRAVSADGFDEEAEAQARSYFNTNFDQSSEGTTATVFNPTSPDDGNTIEGAATTNLDTILMGVFGFQNLSLAVSCSASMSVGNSDVVMVLDSTGSMAETLEGTSVTRLSALQDAMKNFYDTVNGATQGTNARIRYGFVPYSSSINVGRLLNEDWISDSHTIQSRVPQFTGRNVVVLTGWGEPYYGSSTGSSEITSANWVLVSGPYSKQSQCNDAEPVDTAWVNRGTTSTSTDTKIDGEGRKVTTTTTSQPQRRTDYECYRGNDRKYYVISRQQDRDFYNHQHEYRNPVYTTETVNEFDYWIYKNVAPTDPFAPDFATYKTFNPAQSHTGTNGTPRTFTWDGCIEERATVSASEFTVAGSTISPADAADLDIDGIPDSSNPATQWKPMWQGISYYRTVVQDGREYLTNSPETQRGRATGTYCPYQAQLLTEMDESAFDGYADSLTAQGSTYHDIGMIWGARLSSPTGPFSANVTDAPDNGGAVARHIIFMTDGVMAPNYNIQSTYGVEWHDRRVTNDGYTDQATRHTARFLAVCAATKAKGIRVWVIAFASGLTTQLERCASSDSSFTASNADELNKAFQEIAKDVGELRITQ